jgi:predicted 3-demethylubiquinone-9 3-methyltransferase (glyoxalase superfamily)
MPEGTVMTVEFELEGQKFIALNGGPVFKFNEAVSFVVNCESQEEIDFYWEKLTRDGDPSAQQCGWLKDKFGLSWQVSPVQLDEMLQDKDREKSERVMKVMLKMKKLDLAKLEQAYRGEKVEA